MNLLNKLTEKEINLLQTAGVYIEDKDYNNDELKRYELSIEEFIMSHSTKNGDISKYSSQYNSILSKINYYKK